MTNQMVVGYMIMDSETNAVDWDGLVYDTYLDAVAEAVRALHLDDGERWPRPPDHANDLPYEVVEVRHMAASDREVLEQADKAWRRHWSWIDQ